MKGTLERMRDLYDRTRHKDLPAAEVRCAASTTVLFGSFVRSMVSFIGRNLLIFSIYPFYP